MVTNYFYIQLECIFHLMNFFICCRFSGKYPEHTHKNDPKAEELLSTAKFDARFQMCNQDKYVAIISDTFLLKQMLFLFR